MIFNPLLLIRTSIASKYYTILVKLTTNYVSCITLPNIISLFIFPVLIDKRYKHAVNAPLKQDKETLVVLKRTSSVVAQMTGTSDEKDHYEITINKTRVKIDKGWWLIIKHVIKMIIRKTWLLNHTISRN